MPPTLNAIVRDSTLNLRLVTPEAGDAAAEVPVSWVHSSDLGDPTPFLDPGQLLLTDGTQFPVGDAPAALYGDYVERLVAHGISGLGFATQVIHGVLPAGLVEACRTRGLPLLEVPDRTPFIAVIRFVADWLATEQHARSEWSLQAQRAIARAALRPDGLRSILAELERQLHGWVALFDAAGNHILMPNNRPVPSALMPGVEEAVRKSLDKGSRSVSQLTIDGGHVTLQTLGRRHHLRGVLVLGAIEPLDPARTDIINSVIALASLALEQTRTLDTARRHLRAGVLEQLLAGSFDVAERTARQVWGRLPAQPLLVTLAQPPGQGQNLLEALELLSDDHRGAIFYAQRNENIVVLAGPALQPKVSTLLDKYAATAGVSAETDFAHLPKALAEAERALKRATELSRPLVAFEDISQGGMLGLLRRDEAASVARRLLEPLTRHDDTEQTQLLPTVTAWLANNCVWDRTARELGIHRHTLRNRIDAAGNVLGLNLDNLRDRLELFAAVEFVEERPQTSS
ncbi:PucR family transcriptional regulator ligand-binding domain-containing protein [Paenarthrobacter nicotinovorans]|uniref:PucR family transcriptional regulator ligand-binding domain-containing protein n=2 Tax=Paenarthrobacter nicotinovorans TaxID=29320 RepID=A0ABV0GPB9_PAENI|nr:PucR family transcriptional regulator [Paenarthrobacter nicotinovorans]